MKIMDGCKGGGVGGCYLSNYRQGNLIFCQGNFMELQKLDFCGESISYISSHAIMSSQRSYPQKHKQMYYLSLQLALTGWLYPGKEGEF